MSVVLLAGASFKIATAYGAVKAMSSLSNAPNAVAALVSGHNVAPNDFCELTTGWELQNGRLAMATAVAGDNVTFGKINTQNLQMHPAGSSAGSVREISTWTPLSQITPQFSISGGEQNYADATFVSHLIKQRIPTDRNPINITLPYFFDLSLPWVDQVVQIAESATPAGFRMDLRNGNIIVANAYWSIREFPTAEDGTLRGQIDLSLVGSGTMYAGLV